MTNTGTARRWRQRQTGIGAEPRWLGVLLLAAMLAGSTACERQDDGLSEAVEEVQDELRDAKDEIADEVDDHT